jgi:DDE superfamily endonuclease
MNLHLVEIAQTVEPGAHAVLLVDQAGWHLSTRLVVPPNITIIALPPKSPELNPVENVWLKVGVPINSLISLGALIDPEVAFKVLDGYLRKDGETPKTYTHQSELPVRRHCPCNRRH